MTIKLKFVYLAIFAFNLTLISATAFAGNIDRFDIKIVSEDDSLVISSLINTQSPDTLKLVPDIIKVVNDLLAVQIGILKNQAPTSGHLLKFLEIVKGRVVVSYEIDANSADSSLTRKIFKYPQFFEMRVLRDARMSSDQWIELIREAFENAPPAGTESENGVEAERSDSPLDSISSTPSISAAPPIPVPVVLMPTLVRRVPQIRQIRVIYDEVSRTRVVTELGSSRKPPSSRADSSKSWRRE